MGGAAAERAGDRRRPETCGLIAGAGDHDDDMFGRSGHDLISGRCQPPGRDGTLQRQPRSGHGERQHSGVDRGHGRLAGVVDGNARAAIGKSDRQRQADISAAADDDNVMCKIAGAA
jgi:hypothetical protein